MLLNIARLFSYTRQVERERDALQKRVEALEAKLDERTSYAFALTGRPTPETVKARGEATGVPAAPLPKRPSLRMVRRDFAREIIAKREPKDGPMKEMGNRADEFAGRMKA